MSGDRIIGKRNEDSWKAWAVGLIGAISCFGIGAVSGIGSDRIFIQPGQDVGYAIGSGLGIALLVWLVLNFTALRGHSWGLRIVAYLLMVMGGAIGVMQNL